VLTFDWDRPVGAAVFLYAGHLWAVFGTDPPDRVVPADLPPELAGHLDPGHVIEADGGVAIRFRLERPLAPEVERDGNSWRVRLRPEPAPTKPVEIVRLDQPARLRVIGGESPRLVRVIDPTAGSALEIWPLLRAGLGQPGARQLVDLELLATAQGVAWRPLQDQLRARLLDNAIELGRSGGLRLSAPRTRPAASPEIATSTQDRPGDRSAPGEATPSDPQGPANAQAAQASSGTIEALGARSSARADGSHSATGAISASSVDARQRSPLDLGSFGHMADDQLQDLRVRLLHEIARSTPESRAAARLELARVFLAQAMAAEALGALGAIDKSDPGRPETALAGSALTGAAQLLMDRHDEAEARLVAADLDDDREAALWRAALAAAEQDWPRAMRDLTRSGGVIGDYPKRLQSELGLLLAKAAIEAGEVARAGELLERIAALDLPPAEHAQVSFLTGLARARAGRSDEAEEIWDGCRSAPIRGSGCAPGSRALNRG
jgi:hypothetical protein